MEELIGDITNKDRMLGYAAGQMHASAEKGYWFPALASLFLLTEQALRWATNSDVETNWSVVIASALSEGLVLQDEADTLNLMRRFRNKYIHASFHSDFVELDGLIHQISEPETAEALFELFSMPCLKIIYKLLNNSKS